MVLKNWNLTSFGNTDKQIATLESKIEKIDKMGESSNLDDTMLDELKKAQVEPCELMELLVMMEPSVEECLEKFRATPDSCSPILILLRGVWIRAWIANSRCQRPSTLEDSTAMSIHRELQVAIIGDDGGAAVGFH
ncbi:hypothetical protein V6N13_127942 [Hibiscus sabdariffa]